MGIAFFLVVQVVLSSKVLHHSRGTTAYVGRRVEKTTKVTRPCRQAVSRSGLENVAVLVAPEPHVVLSSRA